MKPRIQTNAYLNPAMPLERIRQDSEHSVSLARRALAVRDPVAARLLHIGIDPSEQQQRVLVAGGKGQEQKA